MLRHFYRLMVVALGVFVVAACTGAHTVKNDVDPTDHGGIVDEDVVDEDVIGGDAVSDSDMFDACNEQGMLRDADFNCKLDSDCGTCFICTLAKCTKGCIKDEDCAAHPGTTCNTGTHRCLNETANDGACNEANCPSGCCYATEGFRGLACASIATLGVCGICHQGEVYMDGKQCVPAACATGNTNCRTYNAYDDRAECFTCSATTFVCADDQSCVVTSDDDALLPDE